jgi:hypothetical protein
MLLSGKKGHVVCYDGHVDMMPDPWPWRSTATGSESWALLSALQADISPVPPNPQGPGAKALDPLLQSIYAQRGVAVPIAAAIQLFLQ